MSSATKKPLKSFQGLRKGKDIEACLPVVVSRALGEDEKVERLKRMSSPRLWKTSNTMGYLVFLAIKR